MQINVLYNYVEIYFSSMFFAQRCVLVYIGSVYIIVVLYSFV